MYDTSLHLSPDDAYGQRGLNWAFEYIAALATGVSADEASRQVSGRVPGCTVAQAEAAMAQLRHPTREVVFQDSSDTPLDFRSLSPYIPVW